MSVIAFLVLHLSTYVFDLLGYQFIPDYNDSGTAGVLGTINMLSFFGLVVASISTEARRWSE